MRAMACILILVVASPCLASTWDLAADWSDLSNPNGPWTYREGSNALPGVAAWQELGLGFPQPAWAVGEAAPAEYLPAWFKAVMDPDPVVEWFMGDVVVHTTDPANGPSQGDANVIWTSPVAGSVDIAGSAWLTRDIGRAVDWSPLHNGSLLTVGSLYSGDPFTRSSPMNFAAGTGGAGVIAGIPVQIGDVIELRLDTTSPNTLGDLIGINLTISEVPTGINDSPVPARFVLHDPVPNPFNPSMTITFDVPEGGDNVTVEIFDITGRRVRTLANGNFSAGPQQATWNGIDNRGVPAPSGIYLCHVKARGFEDTRKISLVK
ncbi:MAG: T9SS type A sorting domain-containing protein [Candidatus Krumholzibacteria bacterium]|nr:T9SS type A sorting domain-containing protein [Candidatus Krumholzibacteria bacterium]